MNPYKKFEAALNALENGNLNLFLENVIEHFSDITCDCWTAYFYHVKWEKYINLYISEKERKLVNLITTFDDELAKHYQEFQNTKKSEQDLLTKILECNCEIQNQSVPLKIFDNYFIKGFLYYMHDLESEINFSAELRDLGIEDNLKKQISIMYFNLALNNSDYYTDEDAELSFYLLSNLEKSSSKKRISYANLALDLQKNSRNYFNVGSLITGTEFQKGITHLTNAINFGKLDVSCAYNKRAFIKSMMNDKTGEIIDYEHSISSNKGNFFAYKNLALCYEKTNIEKAIHLFYKQIHVLEKFPSIIKGQFGINIMEIYDKIGGSLLIIVKTLFENGDYLHSEKHCDNLFEFYLKSYPVVSNLKNPDNLVNCAEIFIKGIFQKNDIIIDINNKIYERFQKMSELNYDNKPLSPKLEKLKNDFNRIKIYEFDDLLLWGKYNGKVIDEVCKYDYGYLLWCIINLTHFAITSVFFTFKNVRADNLFLRALEINEIKKIFFVNDFFCSNNGNSNGYEEYRSGYGEYGGAYGFDDDTINSAFEGDPENYWNIA